LFTDGVGNDRPSPPEIPLNYQTGCWQSHFAPVLRLGVWAPVGAIPTAALVAHCSSL